MADVTRFFSNTEDDVVVEEYPPMKADKGPTPSDKALQSERYQKLIELGAYPDRALAGSQDAMSFTLTRIYLRGT